MKKDKRGERIRKRKLRRGRSAIRIKDPKSPIKVRWMTKQKPRALKQMKTLRKAKMVKLLKKIRL